MILMGFPVVMREDSIDLQPLDELVDKPYRVPTVLQLSDGELPEKVVRLRVLTWRLLKNPSGLVPCGLDRVPGVPPVRARCESDRVDIVPGPLLLEKGAEASKFHVVRMGSDCKNVHGGARTRPASRGPHLNSPSSASEGLVEHGLHALRRK